MVFACNTGNVWLAQGMFLAGLKISSPPVFKKENMFAFACGYVTLIMPLWLYLNVCFTHLESVGTLAWNAYFYAGKRRFWAEFLADHHLITVYEHNVRCMTHKRAHLPDKLRSAFPFLVKRLQYIFIVYFLMQSAPRTPSQSWIDECSSWAQFKYQMAFTWCANWRQKNRKRGKSASGKSRK